MSQSPTVPTAASNTSPSTSAQTQTPAASLQGNKRPLSTALAVNHPALKQLAGQKLDVALLSPKASQLNQLKAAQLDSITLSLPPSTKTNQNQPPSNTLTIRIPAAQRAQVLNQLKQALAPSNSLNQDLPHSAKLVRIQLDVLTPHKVKLQSLMPSNNPVANNSPSSQAVMPKAQTSGSAPAASSHQADSTKQPAPESGRLVSTTDLSALTGQKREVQLLSPKPEQLQQLKPGDLQQIKLSLNPSSATSGNAQTIEIKIPPAQQAQVLAQLQQAAAQANNKQLINLQIEVLATQEIKLQTLAAAKAINQGNTQQFLQQVLGQLSRQDVPLAQLNQLPQLIKSLNLALAELNGPKTTPQSSATGKSETQPPPTSNVVSPNTNAPVKTPATPLSQTLQQQLQQLLQQFPSSQTASQPQQLKGLLQQSGLFFEQQQSLTKVANTLDLLKSDSGLNPPKGPNSSALNTTSSQAPLNPSTNTALPSDLKASLLQLSKLSAEAAVEQQQSKQHKTAPLIAPQIASQTEQELKHLRPQQFSQDLAQALAGFIKQQILSKSDKPQALDKNSLDLFRLLTGALARVQINQISSHPASAQAEPGTINQWQFDLVLNHQSQLDNVQLLLREHYWHQGEEHDQDQQTKQRRWSAIINFDIPPYGTLAIELNLQADKLHTKIWAQHQGLYKLLDSELGWLQDALRSTGIEVESIETFNNSGPQAKARLEQQLVDVQI